ncbi:MAG: hypothetical protein IPH35_12435 [Rhodoferax sp.]|nr:hypothetical protein [Rhodoferax sp.]
MTNHGPDTRKVNLSASFNNVDEAKFLDTVIDTDNHFLGLLFGFKEKQKSRFVGMCRVKYYRARLSKQLRQAFVPINI